MLNSVMLDLNFRASVLPKIDAADRFFSPFTTLAHVISRDPNTGCSA